MTAFVVTGTDTGIGKTVFSAGLTAALGATYWKPVQAGIEEETDSELVARLTGPAPNKKPGLTPGFLLSVGLTRSAAPPESGCPCPARYPPRCARRAG